MDPIDALRKNRALIKRRFGVRRIGVFGSHASAFWRVLPLTETRPSAGTDAGNSF